MEISQPIRAIRRCFGSVISTNSGGAVSGATSPNRHAAATLVLRPRRKKAAGSSRPIYEIRSLNRVTQSLCQVHREVQELKSLITVPGHRQVCTAISEPNRLCSSRFRGLSPATSILMCPQPGHPGNRPPTMGTTPSCGARALRSVTMAAAFCSVSNRTDKRSTKCSNQGSKCPIS